MATRALGAALRASLLAAALAGAAAQAGEPAAGAPPAGGQARPRPPRATAAAEAARWHARHGHYFERNWGVDVVGVRRVSSGYMLRFNYRVVDPGRAAALTDRKVRPYLIDEATHTALAVPAMENVGELRQVAPLEPNRTYFMIFGNPGGLVRKGGHVTLVIGNFRAEGLVVD
ncbi:hypothetical protein [Anaeromyxobacter diazotrophicus]|uniref:hypothetical protein n=1 Tax=Anaeromyxobacter diazotrophicus TaxID=2590199 RepID=UPI00159010F1|nr:hypothetical protein [Anaeromyxobacter diazotrophicus]